MVEIPFLVKVLAIVLIVAVIAAVIFKRLKKKKAGNVLKI